MNASVETEPERVVLFQPRSINILVVNLSATETATNWGAANNTYRVADAQADELTEALQEERISQAVLNFGCFAGIWTSSDDIKKIELTSAEFRKESAPLLVRYFAAGASVVAVGAATRVSLLRYKCRTYQFRHAPSAAGSLFTPAVMLANALNHERADEKLLHQLSRENTESARSMQRCFSAYDRLETATLLAARHAGVAPEQPSSADLVRLVCRGLDIFSESLNTAHSDVD